MDAAGRSFTIIVAMNGDELQQDLPPQWLSSPRRSHVMEGRSASGNPSWPPSAIEDFCSVHLAQSQADLRRATLNFGSYSGSGAGSGSSSGRGFDGAQLIDHDSNESGDADDDDGSPAFLLHTPSSSSDDDDNNQLWPDRWGSDSDDRNSSTSSSEDEMGGASLLRAASDDAFQVPDPSNASSSGIRGEEPSGIRDLGHNLNQGAIAASGSGSGAAAWCAQGHDSDEESHQSWDWLDEDGDLLEGSNHDDVSGARSYKEGDSSDYLQFPGMATATASSRSTVVSATSGTAAVSPHSAATDHNHSSSSGTTEGRPLAPRSPSIYSEVPKNTSVACEAAAPSPPPIAALRVPRGLHIAVRD